MRDEARRATGPSDVPLLVGRARSSLLAALCTFATPAMRKGAFGGVVAVVEGRSGWANRIGAEVIAVRVVWSGVR